LEYLLTLILLAMPAVTSAELNVYSGENALVDYYDPDKNPPVPVRFSLVYALVREQRLILHNRWSKCRSILGVATTFAFMPS
jgi:hypothetical protein